MCPARRPASLSNHNRKDTLMDKLDIALIMIGACLLILVLHAY